MAALGLSRLEIERSQFDQLSALLRRLTPDNRFYSQKLAGSGLDLRVNNLDDFKTRCPFTFKREIAEDQQLFPPYGSNLTFPLDRYTRFHQTSGSFGAPLRWLDTPESWARLASNWDIIFGAAGVKPLDRILFAFSFGPFIGFWLAFESAARLGCLCLPTGGLSSSARLRLLLDNQATVICCTPSYALRLAEVAATEGIDLSTSMIKTIMVAGEPGGSLPATRSRLEHLWPGARVFDHHGMTEVGPVSYQCPAQPGVLHVIETAYLPEIIDPPTGQPVPPGNPGELVLTSLGRLGSPLLRYRTGDLVRTVADQGGSCTCGRFDLRLEGGILGRTDDMLIVRGVNIYPTAVEEIIRQCGVDEYQIAVSTQSSLTQLEVCFEPPGDCVNSDDAAKKIQQAFQVALSLRVGAVPVATGTLPRAEMKAKRWIRN